MYVALFLFFFFFIFFSLEVSPLPVAAVGSVPAAINLDGKCESEEGKKKEETRREKEHAKIASNAKLLLDYTTSWTYFKAR